MHNSKLKGRNLRPLSLLLLYFKSDHKEIGDRVTHRKKIYFGFAETNFVLTTGKSVFNFCKAA